MPNAIKYKAGNLTGSLQKGNVALGVSGSLGPTSTTGWYNGPNPVAGKYQIFETAVSGDPDVFCPQDDNELIKFARWKGATGANTGSAAAVLAWIGTQSNLMASNFQYESIVTDGLVLNLDAGFVGSYPTTGSTWYDLSGNSYNGTLINSPTFSSANSGSIVFDGTDDVVDCGNNSTLRPTVFTQTSWIYNIQSGGQQGIFGSYYEPRVSGFFISLLDNKPRFVIGTNTGVGIGLYTEISGTIINQNTWCQLTISYDGTTMKIYKNGVLDASSTWTSGIGYDITNNKVAIGAVMISSGFVIPFKGNISNCLLYNQVLSQTEITQNFNAQKGRFGL